MARAPKSESAPVAAEALASAEIIAEPIEAAPELVTDIVTEPSRQWSYNEMARYQLTGEYPEWFTQPKT